MKNIGWLLAIAVLLGCSSKRVVLLDKGDYNYAVVGLNADLNGIVLVKSFATGRNYEEIRQNVLRKVLREVIFSGISNGNRSTFQKPLINEANVEQREQAYFFQLYASIATAQNLIFISRELATQEQIKSLTKSQNTALSFEVGVDLDRIRERLINEGIIKKIE